MDNVYDRISNYEFESYERIFNYENYKVTIRRDCLEEIVITLRDPIDMQKSCELILQQLKHKNYLQTDFFQQTIKSYPIPRKGLGSKLHDFLIENKDAIGISNIYSTNQTEDLHLFSVDAEKFWQKRVEMNKAEWQAEKGRFKIKWNA